MATKIAVTLLVLMSLQQVLSSRMLQLGGAPRVLLSDVCTESLNTTFSLAEEAVYLGNPATYRKYEEYSISWTVKITEGKEVADEIAEKYGFTNTGQASCPLFLLTCANCFSACIGSECVLKFVSIQDSRSNSCMCIRYNLPLYFYYPIVLSIHREICRSSCITTKPNSCAE